MTREEAIIEARKRFGSRGFAHHAPNAEQPYEVGYIPLLFPVVVGRGGSWEAAFANAEVVR